MTHADQEVNALEICFYNYQNLLTNYNMFKTDWE